MDYDFIMFEKTLFLILNFKGLKSQFFLFFI